MRKKSVKKDNEAVTQTNIGSLIKVPGDRIEQYMTPKGDVITKVDTKERNITHRQYGKKDGSKGKQTIIIKQID